MEFKDIDKIIERYFEGQTTLEEEKLIKEYLKNTLILPSKHTGFKDLFQFYNSEREEKSKLQLDDVIPAKKTNTKVRRIIIYGLAASIALLISFFFTQSVDNENHAYAYINGKPIKDKEVVFKEAQKALFMISNNLNEGTQNLNRLSEFNKAEEILKPDK